MYGIVGINKGSGSFVVHVIVISEKPSGHKLTGLIDARQLHMKGTSTRDDSWNNNLI